MISFLKFLIIVFLISIEVFSQHACLDSYRGSFEIDQFKNWSFLKKTLLESGLVTDIGSIRVEFVDASAGIGSSTLKNIQTESSDINAALVERFIKVTYVDNNGNDRTKFFSVKTENYNSSSKWKYSILSHNNEFSAEDVYLDLVFGKKTNDSFKILSSIRLEMETVHNKIINSTAANNYILGDKLFSLSNEMKRLAAKNSSSHLSPDIVEFITKWNNFKRLNYPNQEIIKLSKSLVEQAIKSRYFEDAGGNSTVTPTSANFVEWLNSASVFLKFYTPLLGTSVVEKNENFVKFEFTGTISREVSKSFVERKLKLINLLEFSNVEITSLKDSSFNHVSIKFSNISLLRQNELKNLVTFFNSLEFFFESESNQGQALSWNRLEVISYLKKKSRKNLQRLDSLDKKIIFIRKAYLEFYRNKTRSFNFSDLTYNKSKISNQEVLQFLEEVFPNLSVEEKQIITTRKNQNIKDFLSSLKL